jgi:hypothetical protein
MFNSTLTYTRIAMLIATVLGGTAPAAWANDNLTRDLTKYCDIAEYSMKHNDAQPRDAIDLFHMGYCLGQVSAGLDFLMAHENLCIPNTLRTAHFVLVVQKYIRAHEEVLLDDFFDVMTKAAFETWPCKNVD